MCAWLLALLSSMLLVSYVAGMYTKFIPSIYAAAAPTAERSERSGAASANLPNWLAGGRVDDALAGGGANVCGAVARGSVNTMSGGGDGLGFGGVAQSNAATAVAVVGSVLTHAHEEGW